MQTTEGYALRKLKGSPEVLVTRVIRGSQNMISMKKKTTTTRFSSHTGAKVMQHCNP